MNVLGFFPLQVKEYFSKALSTAGCCTRFPLLLAPVKRLGDSVFMVNTFNNANPEHSEITRCLKKSLLDSFFFAFRFLSLSGALGPCFHISPQPAGLKTFFFSRKTKILKSSPAFRSWNFQKNTKYRKAYNKMQELATLGHHVYTCSVCEVMLAAVATWSIHCS